MRTAVPYLDSNEEKCGSLFGLQPGELRYPIYMPSEQVVPVLVCSSDAIMNVWTRINAMWSLSRGVESILVDVQLIFF